MSHINREILAWVEALLGTLPGRIGMYIRSYWYKFRMDAKGDLRISPGCEFVSPERIRFEGLVFINTGGYFNADGGSIIVGDWTSFNRGVHINASGGGVIKFGVHCLIGPGVIMRTANHRHSDPSDFMQNQGLDPGDITIEDDCWVGSNAVLLKGAHIGKGAIIGAGAVVLGYIPPMAIAVGVPAKVVKYRCS